MKQTRVADYFWGSKARLSFLLLAAAILLFTLLGARDIWTQEHRWADIVSGMFYRQDFLHPYLGENDYYDKPLLSYWLIVAVSWITGQLTTWTLRLPSALAGLLAIWSIYRLGTRLKDTSLGFLSAWIMLTTFYFIFWARTSSADMLNLAGSLFAIAWYADKRDHATFFDYVVFFLVLSLTSLCKGLVGAVVPVLVILTDVILRQDWKRYLRLSIVLAALPALVVYILPFWASSHFGGESYGQSGLYLVYRENILRYLHPFDHQGPVYTYFLYLPIYLLPWAVFFLPALLSLKKRWSSLSMNAKWITWSLLVLFMFFTLSGSRRSYYVLPIVPIAILFTADWILSSALFVEARNRWSAGLVVSSFIFIFLAVDVLPACYYSAFGVSQFASQLKEEASYIKPWEAWKVVMLDAENKLSFYLQLPPATQYYQIKGSERVEQTPKSILKSWPVLQHKPANTIFITRKMYVPALAPYFKDYHMVELTYPHLPFLKKHDTNVPVAFIPLTRIF